MNLQANYEAELLDLNETETVTEEEQKIFNELKEVAKYLKINVKQSIEQKILDLRKALRVSSLTNLQRILPSGAFRTSTKVTVNPTVVGAWLRICQLEGEKHNIKRSFNTKEIDGLIAELMNFLEWLLRENTHFIVTSAFRTVAQNDACNGSKNSQHLTG